jgi:hypothetical protein
LLNRIGPFLFLAQAFRCVFVHPATADNVAKALGWYCQVILPTLSCSSAAVLLQRRPGGLRKSLTQPQSLSGFSALRASPCR